MYILALLVSPSSPVRFTRSDIGVSQHIISLGIRAVNAFIKNRNIEGGPSQYYVETANSSYLLQVTTYATQTLVGDGFLVRPSAVCPSSALSDSKQLYRLYVVWAKDNRILVPGLIFWMGGIGAFTQFFLVLQCLTSHTIVSGIGTLVHEATASPTTPIFVFKAWITSFFVITLFTNLTATSMRQSLLLTTWLHTLFIHLPGLIAGKIWMSERRTAGFLKSHTLSPILIIVIESGAVYSISLIALLATFLISNWGQYVVLDPVSPCKSYLQNATTDSIVKTKSVYQIVPLIVSFLSPSSQLKTLTNHIHIGHHVYAHHRPYWLGPVAKRGDLECSGKRLCAWFFGKPPDAVKASPYCSRRA